LDNDKSKLNKQIDDKTLGNQFKQVEDSLINLSKILETMQLANSSSFTRTVHHQPTLSSVVIYLVFKNNN
jgi:hypothetical protein